VGGGGWGCGGGGGGYQVCLKGSIQNAGLGAVSGAYPENRGGRRSRGLYWGWLGGLGSWGL